MAFLLTATKGQFEEVKSKTSGLFDFWGVDFADTKIDYGAAREVARAEASAQTQLSFTRNASRTKLRGRTQCGFGPPGARETI
jgi:hypothetical protein